MFIALDLETTGVDRVKDKIIEIALIRFDEQTFEIIDSFSTLINPEIPIPEIISNITNITDGDIKNAPILDDNLRKQIIDFIGDNPLLGHNTSFDRDFLVNNGVNISKNIILDTFVLANIFLFHEKSLNLGSLCQSFGIDLSNAHRAFEDAKGTLLLFQKLTSHIKNISYKKKEILHYIFHYSLDPSFGFYSNYFGFSNEIISEEKLKQHLIESRIPFDQKNEKQEKHSSSFQKESIEQLFESLPNSEKRENQILMAKKVHETLINQKKIMIEAPTGVGKTFAYLIPSLLLTKKTQEQVVVSTNTKTLQDQIYYKDLAFLSQHIGCNFSYTKLKGKKNYFSFFRYFFMLGTLSFDGEETAFLSKLSLWVFESDFCELDEINFYGKEYVLLGGIHSDHFLVLQDENPYKYSEPLYIARKRAMNSDIVVINHSLLIQDTVSLNPIFGQIQNLILDEAHNLEDAVTEGIKKKFSLSTFKEAKERVFHSLQKHSVVGDNLDNKFRGIMEHIGLAFDILSSYALKKLQWVNDINEVLIEKDFFEQEIDVSKILHEIEILFTDIFNQFSLFSEPVYQSIQFEIGVFQEILTILKISFSKDSIHEYISIFSYSKYNEHSLSFTVLNVGNFLQKNIWDTIPSIVLTSATLQIGGDFSYVKKAFSLQNDFDFLSIESDFDYSKQSLMFIPQDLGSIKYNNPKISQFLLDFLLQVKGKTLMLFTSFQSIKEQYLALNTILKNNGIILLAQGISGSKHKMMQHFKENSQNTVLFGTESFWEGIDIPGEDLQYLIIYKFPFSVPTDPIFKARGNLYSDAFFEYSVPKAILKTKQGFGRLIRTKNDSGIMILLDDRIYSTSWGAVMNQAFPQNINIKMGRSSNFLQIIENKMKSLKV